jgi:hypothetical protein
MGHKYVRVIAEAAWCETCHALFTYGETEVPPTTCDDGHPIVKCQITTHDEYCDTLNEQDKSHCPGSVN